MNLNKDLINIIRLYLTISKDDVKRNKDLMIFHLDSIIEDNIDDHNYFFYDNRSLQYLVNNDIRICNYCHFCDNMTYQYPDMSYDLITSYKDKNTKLIYGVLLPCEDCYNACLDKCKVMEQLIKQYIT